MELSDLIGIGAALCTTVSLVPQLRKCWRTGRSHDVSMVMAGTLLVGVFLWVVYGMLRNDPVIVMANVASCAFAGLLVIFKLRERGRSRVPESRRVTGRGYGSG